MEAFETFWAAYPKKRKKLDALKAWQRLNPSSDLLAEMLSALKWQRQSEDWTKEGGQYVPLPATWLRAGQWMDEPEVQVAPALPTNKRIAGLIAGGNAFLNRRQA